MLLFLIELTWAFRTLHACVKTLISLSLCRASLILKKDSYKDTYLVLWSEPACMMLALWFVTHRTTNLNWKTTHWRIQNALKKNLVKIPREASLYLPLYKIYSSFSCRDSELFVECHTGCVAEVHLDLM